MTNTKNVSARIFRYVRKVKKMSQQQMAIKLMTTQSTISKVEQGIHFPSSLILKRLEQLTNRSMRELASMSRES